MFKILGLVTAVTALMIINNGCAFFWKEGYAEIEAVEIQVSAERPAFVKVHITGWIGDPTCGTKLLPPHQERKGTTVRIAIRTRERTNVICYMSGVAFETTVLLKGRFVPGVYRVIVSSKANSLEKEFEVPP